jgi:type VI secretion system secreted protein Hcp
MDLIVLQLPGVTGDSTSKAAPKSIELTSVSHGVTMPMSDTSPGGSSAKTPTGVSRHSDVMLSRIYDSSSPDLHVACAKGNIYPKATIRFYANDDVGNTAEVYSIELENVLISSVQLSGNAGGKPTEQIALNFTKITWTYTKRSIGSPMTAKGKAVAGFDIGKNKAV